jgi:hypothetical protein
MSETIMSEDQVVWKMDTSGAGIITGSVAISNANIDVDVNVSDYVSVVGSPGHVFPIDEQVAAFSYVYSGDLITQMVRTTPLGSEVKDLTYSGVLISTIGSWY